MAISIGSDASRGSDGCRNACRFARCRGVVRER
jgi:hypothetical protein